MKITIEADCTPAELREFMGLPDVKKMQDKWFAEFEEKIMASAKSTSPDQLIQSWIGGASANIEQFASLLNAVVKPRK